MNGKDFLFFFRHRAGSGCFGRLGMIGMAGVVIAFLGRLTGGCGQQSTNPDQVYESHM